MKQKTLQVGQIVEIIKLNKHWLDIEYGVEDLIGQRSIILEEDEFEEFGKRYRIIVEMENEDMSFQRRTLWLPAEYLRIIE